MAYVSSELMASCGDGALLPVFSPDAVCAGVTAYLSSVLEALSDAAGDPIGKETVYRTLEAVYEVEESVSQCRDLYGGQIEVGEAVELALLRRHLSTVKMSFEGEPLVGVQVMGILETRNIDFENVLILSVGEDGFPGVLSDQSYIPASLRTGYGMPSSGYREAMYSYYFYRLLQRARRVDIVYNSSSDGMSTGEPSRFIRQLEIESPHAATINRVGISFNVGSREARAPVFIPSHPSSNPRGAASGSDCNTGRPPQSPAPISPETAQSHPETAPASPSCPHSPWTSTQNGTASHRG